jgi:anti-sigma B factor antagonist
MEIVGKKSQGLSVTALNDDKTVIISFNDRSLNFYVTDSLKESLKETINAKIEDGFEHFILNLDNVKIIDSCGVGLIIVANNVTASRSSKLYLCNIKPFIIKIFEIMRISKHLSIFDTEDDALQVIKNGKSGK